VCHFAWLTTGTSARAKDEDEMQWHPDINKAEPSRSPDLDDSNSGTPDSRAAPVEEDPPSDRVFDSAPSRSTALATHDGVATRQPLPLRSASHRSRTASCRRIRRRSRSKSSRRAHRQGRPRRHGRRNSTSRRWRADRSRSRRRHRNRRTRRRSTRRRRDRDRRRSRRRRSSSWRPRCSSSPSFGLDPSLRLPCGLTSVEVLDLLSREITPDDYELLLRLDRAVARPVASGESIEALPKLSPSEFLGGSCSICLTQFQADSNVTAISSCKHQFHRDCISKWLSECRKTCPLCGKEA